jgi:hypothetical protein
MKRIKGGNVNKNHGRRAPIINRFPKLDTNNSSISCSSAKEYVNSLFRCIPI